MARERVTIEARRFTNASALSDAIEVLLASSDYQIRVLFYGDDTEKFGPERLYAELEDVRTLGRVKVRERE